LFVAAQFVTAINVNRSMASPAGDAADVLNGADKDAIELWMTNYCTQNPLNVDLLAAYGANLEMISFVR